MSKPAFGAFADLTSATETAAVEVSHLEEIAVMAHGTFTGTVELQVSFDGTNFAPHPTLTGKTAPFSGEVGFRCKAIRMACTAYTTGTISSNYSGSNADLKGA